MERDLLTKCKCTLAYHFNSHAHVERDEKTFRPLSALKISTHTLTWSVTTPFEKIKHIVQFQLTRSRGACLEAVTVLIMSGNDFNSHAHVERDNTPTGRRSNG